MSSISLIGIQNRGSDILLNKTKNVRVSCFSTPSSFYLQLCDEDEQYRTLDTDIRQYYTTFAALYAYRQKKMPQVSIKPALKKLKIKELRGKMNIAVYIMDKWVRCIVEDDSRRCKLIDIGLSLNLSRQNEENGIFELNHSFLTLPPRAILCGLGHITPFSQQGHRWNVLACHIFQHLTQNQILRAFFTGPGLLYNTYYVFLTRIGWPGVNIHVNTALCAFDTAVVDTTGLHHPIWPCDSPC